MPAGGVPSSRDEPAGGARGSFPPPALSVPERLGKYRRGEMLGAGSNAVVFRATDEELDRQVALKVFRITSSASPEAVELQRREAVFGARLNHPNIARVLDAIRLQPDSRGESRMVLVMESVEGEHLDALIGRAGPLETERALGIAEALADAVCHANSCGVVHRGIKCSNIIVRPDGTPVIIDLGSAAARGAAKGRPPDGCFEDIRGLGLVLVHALTGRSPFPERELIAVMCAVRPPAAAGCDGSSLPPGTPEPVRELVGRMLSDGFGEPHEVRSRIREVRSLLYDRTEPAEPLGLRARRDGMSRLFGPGGRYRDAERLGDGAFGVVYKAFDVELGRRVAVKVLKPEFAASPSAVERFHREAASAARLRHPNVIDVLTIGRDSDVHYFAMELIDGKDLAGLIEEPGTLSAGRSAHVVRQAADGLAAAHEAGIVHRDMKPQNILVDSSWRAVITDFGIALVMSDRRLTAPGTVIGTYHYMSPEQAHGLDVDARSDIYSLGVVLYECLTRTVPFDAGTPLEILRRITEDEPVAPCGRVSGVPRALSDLVMTMLAKNPDERPASAREVAREIARFEG